MNTLLSQAQENLIILKNISKNDHLILSESRKLNIQEDYVQVDNTSELENGIHFTFHQVLSSLNFLKFEESDAFIQLMDEAIDNIFENDKLNELMDGDSELFKIVDNIDRLLESYKESVYYKSPFYELQRNVYKKVDFVKETFLNVLKKEEEIKKGIMYYLHQNKLTKELDSNLIYTSDEDEEVKSDSDSESEINNSKKD